MVQAIPLNRMLTETDGPFTRTGDKPSRPADVAHVVEVLGRLRGLSADDAAANLVRGTRGACWASRWSCEAKAMLCDRQR